MSTAFIGEIRITPYTFTMKGWASCDGQTLLVSQNNALYSLLGTAFGGNGSTTFGLPDLRGRIPLGQGGGASFAATGGAEKVALSTEQMPAHAHSPVAVAAAGDSASPNGNKWAGSALAAYSTSTTPTLAAMGGTLSLAGGSAGATTAHENRMPFLALNYQIALSGTWPSRS
jgi:microcystin-dependent protein